MKKLKAGLDVGEIDLTEYDKDPHSIAGKVALGATGGLMKPQFVFYAIHYQS